MLERRARGHDRCVATPHDERFDEFDEKLDGIKSLFVDGERADEFLDYLDLEGEVEQSIAGEMTSLVPLAEPEKFLEAHHRVMRSLEVLKRNGYRPVHPSRTIPLLTPMLVFGIQLVTRFIVERHLRMLIDQVGGLYQRRESWSQPDSETKSLLKQGRKDVDRVKEGYDRDSPLGLPTFLLGGAVLSTAAGALGTAVDAVTNSQVLILLAACLTIGIFLGGAWAILRGAAVGRKRIAITTERPMQELFRVVGNCGEPHRDQARLFAGIALVLMVLVWVVVPLALAAAGAWVF